MERNGHISEQSEQENLKDSVPEDPGGGGAWLTSKHLGQEIRVELFGVMSERHLRATLEMRKVMESRSSGASPQRA